MKKLIFSLCAAACAASAMAKDIKTVVLTTLPEMHCESCENRIKKNVRFVKGVQMIETNVAGQKVTVKYDADKTSVEKIRQGFKKIGYETKIVDETK